MPGIFFKYELEPMSITIRERTTTLYQFLIRLVGVVGECLCKTGHRRLLTTRRGVDCRGVCASGRQSRSTGSGQSGWSRKGCHPLFYSDAPAQRHVEGCKLDVVRWG